MGQQEVLDYLEKCKQAKSRGEIANAIGDNLIHTSHSIARLVKGREIKIIEIDRVQAMEKYHCKRRMRLYYV